MKTSKKIVGLSAAALLVLTACNPSSSDDEETTGGETDTSGEVSTDISEASEQTLVVWDQEVRGGQNEQMERLN